MRIRFLTMAVACVVCAIGIARPASEAVPHADRVLVLKKDRTLRLLYHGRAIKTYKVALGGDPIGPKTRQGDHQTPEGVYVLDFRSPHS